MRKLKTKEDVWLLTPSANDLKAGAYYAAVSLPWTFNRMMLNTTSAGQQHRALNIAKGVVGQEMLKREMQRVGIKAQTQRKSYRDEDLFDFNAEIGGTLTKLDLKSVNYFTDYAPIGREPFSVDLLMKYAGYADADWRTFFPMLRTTYANRAEQGRLLLRDRAQYRPEKRHSDQTDGLRAHSVPLWEVSRVSELQEALSAARRSQQGLLHRLLVRKELDVCLRSNHVGDRGVGRCA